MSFHCIYSFPFSWFWYIIWSTSYKANHSKVCTYVYACMLMCIPMCINPMLCHLFICHVLTRQSKGTLSKYMISKELLPDSIKPLPQLIWWIFTINIPRKPNLSKNGLGKVHKIYLNIAYKSQFSQRPMCQSHRAQDWISTEPAPHGTRTSAHTALAAMLDVNCSKFCT